MPDNRAQRQLAAIQGSGVEVLKLLDIWVKLIKLYKLKIKKNPDISDFTQFLLFFFTYNRFLHTIFTVHMTSKWKERAKPITQKGNKLNLANKKQEKKERGGGKGKRKKTSENQKLCV